MKARVSFKILLQALLMALVLSAVVPGTLPGMLSANASEKSNGKRPTVLLILDGYGLSDETEHNAIALADTPVMDRLMREYPFAKGNAEVMVDEETGEPWTAHTANPVPFIPVN